MLPADIRQERKLMLFKWKLRDWVQFNIAKSHKNEIWSENLLGEPTFPRGVDFLEFFEETKSA